MPTLRNYNNSNILIIKITINLSHIGPDALKEEPLRT